jgi:hypothetical protein
MENKAIIVPMKRRRAVTQRVKTGCKTCKLAQTLCRSVLLCVSRAAFADHHLFSRLRRLKCDEAKPHCNRCIRFGIECEGYGKDKPAPESAVSRVLQPKTSVTLYTNPAEKLFDEPEEATYFQRFCCYTVEQLSGFRELEFWNRIVLQASHAEPSLRHAATAIGALDFKAISAPGDAEAVRFRKQFAYQEYQKAIVGVRKTLSAKDCDIRTKLIACALFACFEAFHANYEVALTQIFAGIEMIEEHERKRRDPSPKSNAPPLEAIDHEIIQSFNILEIQACAWGDRRKSDLHYERMLNCAEAVENIPSEFVSIKQAGFILSKNMLRGIHLRFSACTDKPANGAVPPFIGLNPCVNADAVLELNRVLASFRQWSAAFEPLYRRARSPHWQNLFQSATLLRMHCLSCVLWVASGSPSIDRYYRRYTKELLEFVSLSKILIEIAASDLGTFSLEGRFVLPLGVAGLNYRHRALRQECIGILTNMERREAIWDAPMLSKNM